MAIGVRIDKKRERELKDTAITSPHGANLTVTKSRATALLARPAIRLGDGSARVYKEGHDQDTNETVTEVSKAVPPRRGDRSNTTPVTTPEGGKGGDE